MADPQITVDLVGWRNKRSGRFAAVSGKARQRSRVAAKAQLKLLKESAEKLSPEGTYPLGRPKDAGPRFKASWRTSYADTPTGGDGELSNTAKHAGLVIFRTKPHPIAAKHAQALRFVVGGKVIFRKRLRKGHPGTRGNDIPAKLVTQLGKGIERDLQKVAADVAVDLIEVWQN